MIDLNGFSTETEDVQQQPSLERAMFVSGVSEHSPAWHLGLRSGDYLLTVDGLNAVDVNLLSMPAKAKSRCYKYYRTKARQQLTITSNGIPLGVNLDKSPEAIMRNYHGFNRDPTDLVSLWDETKDDHIVALATNWEKRKVLWFDKYLPHTFVHQYIIHETEILFLGVAHFENGSLETGMHFIERYLEEYADNWTTNFTAIAYFYLGEAHIKLGNPEEGIEHLSTAYELCSLKRIKRYL